MVSSRHSLGGAGSSKKYLLLNSLDRDPWRHEVVSQTRQEHTILATKRTTKLASAKVVLHGVLAHVRSKPLFKAGACSSIESCAGSSGYRSCLPRIHACSANNMALGLRLGSTQHAVSYSDNRPGMIQQHLPSTCFVLPSLCGCFPFVPFLPRSCFNCLCVALSVPLCVSLSLSLSLSVSLSFVLSPCLCLSLTHTCSPNRACTTT